jgi:hypothetical protein
VVIDVDDNGLVILWMLQPDDGKDAAKYMDVILPVMLAGLLDESEQQLVAKVCFKVRCGFFSFVVNHS